MINIKNVYNFITKIKLLCFLFLVIVMPFMRPIEARAGTYYVQSGGSYSDKRTHMSDTSSSPSNLIFTYNSNGSTRSSSCGFSSGTKQSDSESEREYKYNHYIYPRTLQTTKTDATGCSSIEIYKTCEFQSWWYKGEGTEYQKQLDVDIVIKNITGTVTYTLDGYSNTIIACTSHTYGGYTTTKAATCTAAGQRKRTCSRCGYVEYSNINALGHDYSNKTANSTYLRSNATCTAAATYYYKCSRCSAKGTNYYSNGNSLGHSYTSKTVNDTYLRSKATCTEAATYYYKCSRCSAKGTNYYSNGSAAGHKYTSQTVTSAYLASAATCTQKAKYYYKCENCSAKGTSTYEYGDVDANAHAWVQDPTDAYLKTPSTCISKAVYYYKCSRCGAKGSTYEYGTVSGHKLPDTWETNETSHYKNCELCGERLETVAHTYEGNWLYDENDPNVHYKDCTVCGFRHKVAHNLPIDWEKDETSHYKTCLDCGAIIGREAHNPSDNLSGDANGHFKTCMVCGQRLENAPHTYPNDWNDHDDINHYKKCTDCGYTLVTKKHHEPLTWNYSDDKKRLKLCEDGCGYIFETDDYSGDKILAVGEVNSIIEVNATNNVVLYPSLEENGNTRDYKVKWLESKDDGATWNEVYEVDGNNVFTSETQAKLSYTFTADCSQTFNRYRYYLTNEAGTIVSGEVTLLVYEKYALQNGNLTITTTGYLDGVKTGDYPMNDYNDPRWDGKVPQWRDASYTHLTINDHISTIGAETFKDSTDLEHVTLPASGITSVNESAFENSGLLGIILPSSVSTVKDYAFKDCSNLLDIYFMNRATAISERVGTLPDASDVGIDNYDRGTDKFNRKHGYPVIYGYSGSTAAGYASKFNAGTEASYNFMPIDDSNGHLIHWNYDIDYDAGTIHNLYTDTEVSGTVRIPKSIDGYLITELGNITRKNGNQTEIVDLLGHVIDTNDDGDLVCDSNTTLTTLYIPDSVETIGYGVLVNATGIKEIYDEAYTPQSFDDTVSSDEDKSSLKTAFINIGGELSEGDGSDTDVNEDTNNPDGDQSEDDTISTVGTIYFYSANSGINDAISSKFMRVLYDKELTGITKGVSYTIDLMSRTIQIQTFKGTDYKDTPFDWAADYISIIEIQPETTRLENELFKDFRRIRTITNKSNDIEYVGETAFANVGADVTSNKMMTTYVNNCLYDAVKAIGGNNPFKVSFIDTTKYCGNLTTTTYPVSWTYKAGNGKLIIAPYNTGIDSVMNTYSENDIPWRCAKDNITSIDIKENVKNLTPNLFTKLPRLQEVYNRAYSQTVSGEIFDVIERYEGNDDFSSNYTIHISDETDYATILNLLADKGFDSITEDDLRGVDIKTGNHYIYSYLIKDEVLQELATEHKMIVPVYCNLNDNTAFVEKVPQPESKGYRLESLYLANGKCGDQAYWTISRDGILSITGSGAVYDYKEDGNGNDVPWSNYRDKIKSVSIADKITRLGAFTFAKLTDVKTIEIPSSVTSIGVEAFMESGLTDFEITENIETIDGALFSGCENLTRLTGSDRRYTIVDGNLYSTDGKVLVEYLRDQIYTIDTYEPYETLSTFEIADTVTTIAPYAIYMNKNLNKIYIPSSVTNIGDYAMAKMDLLYFVDCKTGEDGKNVNGKVMTASLNSLEGSGAVFTSKEVVLYQANEDLTKAAQAAGYRVRFYDNMMIDHINANYTGDPVVIGATIPLDKVVFDIVFKSGLNETTTGNDSRFMINESMTITKIGENTFTATYNDGYTEPFVTKPFTITGVNKITEMAAKYTGLPVWYGENLNKSNVVITLKYANGDLKTISGDNEFISYDKTVIETLDSITVDGVNIYDKSGNQDVIVTYNDKQNKIFTDTITVACSDYVEELTASYNGNIKVEATAGVNGLTDEVKKNISVKIKWKSSDNVDTISGIDGSVSYSGGTDVIGENLQFIVTYNKLNRYNKNAVINIPCASNIRDVMFTYTGTAVTKGTSINLANILITIYYKDGTQKSFKADSVSDLVTLEPELINNYGDNIVNITYNPPGFSKTGEIHVQGTIASPIKLIIVRRPFKTVYADGEQFEKAGLLVNCLYDNGEISDVSDDVTIETLTITSETKNVVISYTDNREGTPKTVKTYLAINVNNNQYIKRLSKDFKESYEIDKILFRSKKTEDVAGANESTGTDTESKWTSVKINDTSRGSNEDLSASIKAGYGFEMKIFTKYKTTRGNEEFKTFMQKSEWDKAYETFKNGADDNPKDTATTASVADYIAHKDDWSYLNDIYPQEVPTANPDMLYVRIVKRTAEGDQYTKIGDKNFIVMERTDKDEKEHTIDEGEWWNSEKVFEFPLRTVNENGEIVYTDDENKGDRRLYVSRAAADSGSANTEYIIQIISPAWYGYEPEPSFDDENGKFIENDPEAGTGIKKEWYGGDTNGEKYLHIAYEFSLFVQKNDDVHTHILQ